MYRINLKILLKIVVHIPIEENNKGDYLGFLFVKVGLVFWLNFLILKTLYKIINLIPYCRFKKIINKAFYVMGEFFSFLACTFDSRFKNNYFSLLNSIRLFWKLIRVEFKEIKLYLWFINFIKGSWLIISEELSLLITCLSLTSINKK